MSETNAGQTPPEFYTEPTSTETGPSFPPPPPSDGDTSTDTDSKTDTKTDGGSHDCPSYPPCPPPPKPPKSKPVFVPVTVEVAPIVELFVNQPKICLQNKAKTDLCFFFVGDKESQDDEAM